MWPKLVDVMNCIRKMNSYTTSFTYSLAMNGDELGQEKQDIHVTR